MNLQEYITSKQGKRPNADIAQRWQNRVVAQGLDRMGERGAQQYLSMYGKGIAAPKCILLAIQAQNAGCQEVALGFWKKAYELETGNHDAIFAGAFVPSTTQIVSAPVQTHDENFPTDLQPGRFAPMQPSDALQPRSYYQESDRYWGQPKRDGNKVIVFASADKVYYQSRSMKLRGSPSIEMDEALMKLAIKAGPFVVEGELYFLDYMGKEHRTGAQAAGVNIEASQGNIQVKIRYMIFYAVYAHGKDLRNDTYSYRIIEGNSLAVPLTMLSPIFERVYTARSHEEKVAMAARQHAEGREGEVWFDVQTTYHAGKDTSDRLVRTKYLIEMNAIVTGLTPTTAQDRPFGAIEVSDLTGKPIGSIGTGFSKIDALKIWTRFQSGKQVVIPIVTQGFTENGQVMHGRLSEDFE